MECRFGTYETGDDAFKAVTEFRAMLASALGPLQARIDQQDSEIAALRKRVSELETKQMANAAVSSWAVKELNRKPPAAQPAHTPESKGVGIVHQRRGAKPMASTPVQGFKFNFEEQQDSSPKAVSEAEEPPAAAAPAGSQGRRARAKAAERQRRAEEAARLAAEQKAQEEREGASRAQAAAAAAAAAAVLPESVPEKLPAKLSKNVPEAAAGEAGAPQESTEQPASTPAAPEEAPQPVLSKAAEKRRRQAAAAEAAKAREQQDRALALEEEAREVAALARSFRDELVWCVAQLDAGLLRPDVSPEQERESSKVKKILLNPKTALVKKRCSMNLVFGDYRRLMKQMPSAPDFMVLEASQRVDEMLQKQATLNKTKQ